MTYDIFDVLQSQQYQHVTSRFLRTKLKRGAVLKTNGGDVADVAVLFSGHVRAYLRCGDQEISVFNVERGFPVLTAPGLVLRARRDSEMLVVPRAAFFEIAMSKPDMLWPMYTAIERLLTQTLRLVEAIRFFDVRARLVLYIIEICEHSGQIMQDGVAIPFEHTIEEVANEIGSTRPTTSQTLNRLIKENVVRRLSRKQLLVPDLDRLKKALGSTQDVCGYGSRAPVREICVGTSPLLRTPPHEKWDAAPVPLYRRNAR